MAVFIARFTILAAIFAVSYGQVYMIPNVTELFIKVGDSIILECFTNAKHFHNLTWYYPYSPRSKKPKNLAVKVIQNSTHLRITNIIPQQFGLYGCSLGINDKYYSNDLTLIPFVEVKSDYTYKSRGRTATLACSINVMGHQTEKATWRKRDTPVSALNDSHRFSELNSALVISDINLEDVGEYIASIKVLGLDTPYECKVNVKSKPHVLDFESPTKLSEKDTMVLQCRVIGNPPPEVVWFKNNEALNVKEDERMKLEPHREYQDALLYIRDLTLSDRGEYTCEARSSYFDETANKTISIAIKERVKGGYKAPTSWGTDIILIMCIPAIFCIVLFFAETGRIVQIEEVEEENGEEKESNTTGSSDKTSYTVATQ